ncbi:hypothetical protein BDV10DRAFT_190207 [Aspergillus recurvatus]
MSADFLAQQRRRRDKMQLSCNICRKRKVRCDRNQPCRNCVYRGEDAHCIYAARSPTVSRRSNSDLGHDRLTDAYAQENGIAPPSDTAPSVGSSVGRIQVNRDETSYVGAEHWAVIADSLLGSQQTSKEQSSRWPDLLLGLREGVTVKEMLASVPPKAEVDRLVSRYFNSLDLAAWVSHGPTFQDEYERFWNDPTTASLNWLSILFSMMCLATDLLLQSGGPLPVDGAKAKDFVILFRKRSAQCLVLGDYTKPTTYTVDALLLYFYSELLPFEDTQFGLDVVLATIVRVAMRMGYHRDPSHCPKISIFAGEMRRRMWALLIQLDILVSLQVGLPRMINERDSDTQPPRNILAEELDPVMTTLPPSRPESGESVGSYMRARTSLVSVLGLIHGHVTSVHPLSYATVAQLDEKLSAQHAALPTNLKVRGCSPVTESAAVVMRCLSLDLLFQKSRCVLHRRYMRPQNRLSWETCIDAALTIIRHQSYIHRETRPGGLLSGHLWKITYLATYDFLLASMLLCLGLQSDVNLKPAVASATGLHLRSERYAAMLSGLEDSYTIWVEWCTEWKRSRQVLDIVKLMLGRVKGDDVTSSGEHPRQDMTTIAQTGLGAASYAYLFPAASDAPQTAPPLLEGNMTETPSTFGALDPMDSFDWDDAMTARRAAVAIARHVVANSTCYANIRIQSRASNTVVDLVTYGVLGDIAPVVWRISFMEKSGVVTLHHPQVEQIDQDVMFGGHVLR